MIRAAALKIESKPALRDFAAKHGVADFKLIKKRCESALWDELDEKLEALFIWGRDNGVGSLDALVFVIHAESGVLSGLKSEWAAGINADQPQVFRQILSLDNAGREMRVRRQSQPRYPPSPNL
jgi:hypothetical protein